MPSIRTALATIALVGFAGPALAGGLFIQEFGTPSQATAGSGATAKANDASTAFQNPAGMTRLPSNALMITAGALLGDIRFDTKPGTPFPDGDGGQQGGPGPVIGAHYAHRLWDRDEREYFDRVRLGMALVSISAAVLKPDSNWAGRYEVRNLGLVTLSALPSVAVRVHDTFSVGVGANMMFGLMNYKVAVPLPGPTRRDGQVKFDKLTDFQAGAVVSVLWEPWNHTRLGAMWTQEIDLDLSGDVALSPVGASANISTRIPFAQAVRASVVHELTDGLHVAGNFRWEQWSSLEKQFVTVNGFKTAIDRGWEDTYGGSVGLRWQFAERWALLTGVGYDSSPVSSKDRTADLPVDRQIRLGLGGQWKWTENRTIGISLSYANLGLARIRSETLIGSYESNALWSAAVYISWENLPWDGSI